MAVKAPMIGEWFMDKTSSQLFEVVAVDAHSGAIEIQYVGGEISEIEPENWATMLVEQAAAPEDWSASYEVAAEDLDVDAYMGMKEDPLSMIEPDIMVGFDELY